MSTLQELLDKSMNINEVLEIYKNAIPRHINADEQQGCEELLNSLRDYWDKHLSELTLTEDEISEAQSTLIKSSFNPEAEQFHNRLLIEEYVHDCKNYIEQCRSEIIKLMAKRKKIPLSWQMVLGQVAQEDIEKINLLENDDPFNDIFDDKKMEPPSLAELVDKKLKDIEEDPESLKNFLEKCRLDTKLVAKRYLFVSKLKSVISEDKDPDEKFHYTMQLLSQNKKLFKEDNALKKVLIYALVVLAGLVTLPALAYGGYKVHSFFSGRERKTYPLNNKRIDEAVNSKEEMAAGMYDRVQGALYDALENRHRWFKIFTNEDEDRIIRVTELYDTAYRNATEKHKGKEFGADEISEELEKLLKKELSRENLMDNERFDKFYKAVNEWLPDIAPGMEQYKCDAVQRVMLSVLLELRNQQNPNDDYFFNVKF